MGSEPSGGREEPVPQGQEQWELERMSKLRPTVPARSGVQNEGKAEQGASSAKRSRSPSTAGNVPAERPGSQPEGTILPGGQAESQWKQDAAQRHQEKGVEGLS